MSVLLGLPLTVAHLETKAKERGYVIVLFFLTGGGVLGFKVLCKIILYSMIQFQNKKNF
jgi:hypothetical protein